MNRVANNVVFIVLIGFLSCVSSCSGKIFPDELNSSLDEIDNSKVMVVAHRSCWRLAPENSVDAMNRCVSLGVDMLEIDVRKTKDEKLVVIHDETLDRTTEHTGLVANHTLAELTSFRLREGAGGAEHSLTSSYIPSLDQVLTLLKDRVLINLDVKESLRDETMQMVRDKAMLDQVIIKAVAGSPESPSIANATYLSDAQFMPIIRGKNGELSEQISSFNVMSPIAFEVIYTTEDELRRACEQSSSQGSRCWVNTMWERLAPGHSDDVSIKDPDAHWGHLIDLGVNIIQTDRPRYLIDYLSSKGLH